MKYLLLWPLANIRHNPWVSAITVLGVGGAAFVVATLLGFLVGYQEAVKRDVDRMGYDLLITAKGCPYEAATLMLRGGVGMRYMPDGVVAKLAQEPEVRATFPALIHPVRDPTNPEGMAIFKGVSPGLREALGLEMTEGEWFAADGSEEESDGVILGFEAAELEQRHPGDAYLVHTGGEKGQRRTKVRGVLARTGTQMDGSVLLPLKQVQTLFGLPAKLTGVGIQVESTDPAALERIRERYQQEPELQVVSLSQVEQALRQAMVTLRDVVEVLAATLALMAGALLLNTTLLRTLAEQKRLFVLHAIGFRRRFIFAASLVENLLLVSVGVGLGLLAANVFGGASSAVLTGYLPYAPSGNLVMVLSDVSAMVAGGALVLAGLATLPPLIRIRRYSDLTTLRGA